LVPVHAAAADRSDRLDVTRPGVNRLDPVAAVATVLVLVTSFLPWFRSSWAVGSGAAVTQASATLSAWGSSTWWSVAVVAMVMATVVWFTVQYAGPRAQALRWFAAVTAVGAVALTVWQWLSIPTLEEATAAGGAGWTSTGDDTGIGAIRDNLVTVDVEGLFHGPAWGLYTGLATMTVLALTLVAGTTLSRQRHPHRAGADP
jgi:hypothetical protein